MDGDLSALLWACPLSMIQTHNRGRFLHLPPPSPFFFLSPLPLLIVNPQSTGGQERLRHRGKGTRALFLLSPLSFLSPLAPSLHNRHQRLLWQILSSESYVFSPSFDVRHSLCFRWCGRKTDSESFKERLLCVSLLAYFEISVGSSSHQTSAVMRTHSLHPSPWRKRREWREPVGEERREMTRFPLRRISVTLPPCHSVLSTLFFPLSCLSFLSPVLLRPKTSSLILSSTTS